MNVIEIVPRWVWFALALACQWCEWRVLHGSWMI
jgi:hypothetical protein